MIGDIKVPNGVGKPQNIANVPIPHNIVLSPLQLVHSLRCGSDPSKVPPQAKVQLQQMILINSPYKYNSINELLNYPEANSLKEFREFASGATKEAGGLLGHCCAGLAAGSSRLLLAAHYL